MELQISKPHWKETLREWLQGLKTVSVEPAAILLMTGVLMQYLVYQDFQIENICLTKLNLTEQICKDIVKNPASYRDEQDAIQKVATRLRQHRSIIDHSFPIVFVILMTPWSDHYGRKLPLLIVLVGFIIQSCFHVVLSLYSREMDPYLMNILTGLPRSLSGGETLFQMAAFSYICDITSHKPRTVRTGLLNAAYILGAPLGFMLGGKVVKSGIGYTAAFSIATGLFFAALLIIIFTVENLTKTERLRRQNDSTAKSLEANNLEEDKPSFWTIINPKNNFYEVFAMPFKKRGDYGRLKVWILLIALLCVVAPIHGEFGVMYLYLRDRLCWDIENYGDFSIYNWFIGISGVILSMGIFSKWLKMRDPVVGFLAGISQMTGCFVYAFATTNFLMYLASTIDLMNGTMIVIAKSMLSKIVHVEEIGKLFSLIAIMESVAPLAMDPLYSQVYGQSIVVPTSEEISNMTTPVQITGDCIKNDDFRGWFFIMSAAFTIPAQLAFLWFMCKREKSPEGTIKMSEGNTNRSFTKDPEASETVYSVS